MDPRKDSFIHSLIYFRYQWMWLDIICISSISLSAQLNSRGRLGMTNLSIFVWQNILFNSIRSINSLVGKIGENKSQQPKFLRSTANNNNNNITSCGKETEAAAA